MLDLLETPVPYREDRAATMRRCSQCGEFKSIEDFPIRIKATGLRRTWCRPCCRAYGREHYAKNRPAYLAKADARRRTGLPLIRAWIDQHLRDHPCVDCGCTDITVLEFDHREPGEKGGAVGRVALGATLAAVQREVAKCEVRCANCHRRRTASQFRWTKLVGVTMASGVARPGTTGRYAIIDRAQQDRLFSRSLDGLRRCSRCRELKPLAGFAFRDVLSGDRDYYCRPCRHAYRRAHYERNRSDYIGRAMAEMRMKREDALLLFHDYLRTHPCVDCGVTDIVALEFDHNDPAKKSMDVGAMLGRKSWSAILAEIAKCVVRCANCHRRRTAQQQSWKVRLAELRGPYGRIGALAGVA